MDGRLGFCDHCGQRYGPGMPGAPGTDGAADTDGVPGTDGAAGTDGAQGGGHEACRTARALEPPRYCPRCRRRMVVKVTPTGWSSHCSRHGLTTPT